MEMKRPTKVRSALHSLLSNVFKDITLNNSAGFSSWLIPLSSASVFIPMTQGHQVSIETIFHGTDVVSSLRGLTELEVADPERTPSWMTGEEAASIAVGLLDNLPSLS